MERIKTKFIIAVSGKLSSAADSNAKADLIEELSENLYQRYLDLVAAGMGEEEAYRKALEDLGDVEELLEYLDNLGPNGEIPRQSRSVNFNLDEILRGTEDIVRETIEQTKGAVDQAKIIVKDVAKKLKEKYPDGFSAEIHVDRKSKVDTTVDEDGHVHINIDQSEAEQPREGEKNDWVYGFGYDKKKGGFYTQWGKWKGEYAQCVEGTTYPSAGLTAIDVQIVGDVTVNLAEDPDSDVVVDGDVEELEVRVSEDGVLSIRPFKTASGSFLSRHGLSSADVELTIPARHWNTVHISTGHGDVEVCDALDSDFLSVKSGSGDVSCQGVSGKLTIATGSGDMDLSGAYSEVNVSSGSGDICMAGCAPAIHCSSGSGDIDLELETLPTELKASTASGDVDVAIPDGMGFSLDFRTISGELDTEFAMVGPMGARSGRAVYLDGGESALTLSSCSGDISLRQNR